MGAFSTRLVVSTAVLVLVGAGRGRAQRPAEPADLIVTADRIYAVDQSRPLVQAIAIRGTRIAYAGPRLGANALAGPSTRMLDFPGRTIVPGLADAHGHLTELGFSLQDVDLTGAKCRLRGPRSRHHARAGRRDSRDARRGHVHGRQPGVRARRRHHRALTAPLS